MLQMAKCLRFVWLSQRSLLAKRETPRYKKHL